MTLERSAQAPDHLTPTAFSALVVDQLLRDASIVEESMQVVVPIIEHFGLFIEQGLGIDDIHAVELEHARAFLFSRKANGAEVTYSDRRRRRMALRKAYRIAWRQGIVVIDPTLDLELGGPPSSPARWLLQDEIERCRSYAVPSARDARRSIAWALAESTALTSEMGHVLVEHVSLEQKRIWLHGAPDRMPRYGYFSAWGLEQIERRLRMDLEPSASLISWRTPPKTLRAACSQAIKETFKAAGLVEHDVRPRSIVAWAGRVMLAEDATIDEIARRLGMRSLDETAAFIGYDWRSVE
jgi:site-specific recombinase XerD